MDEKKQTILDKWIKMKAFRKLPKIVTPDCLKDKEFVLGVLNSIKLDFPLLQFVPDKLKKDPEVVLAALDNNSYNLAHMDKNLYKNKDVVLRIVQIKAEYIKYASDALKDDRDVILKAIEQKYGGGAFIYASPRLRKDRELVMKAFESYSWAFVAADKIYWDDREVAMIHPGFALASGVLSPRLCADRELVMAAVKEKPTSYRFASEELKADKEILLCALYNNYMEFCTFSNNEVLHIRPEDEKVPYDDRIFSKGYEDMFPYTYAPKELKLDREVAAMAAGNIGFGYSYILPEMRKYPEVFLAAFKINRDAIKFAPKEILNDVDTMRKAMEIDDSHYPHLPLALRSNKEYMITIIKRHPMAYRFLSHDLKVDKDVVKLVIDIDIGALEYGNKVVKKDNKYYVAFHFDAKAAARAGAIVAAFSGLAGNKQLQQDTLATGQSLMQEGQNEDVSFDIEITEQKAVEIAIKHHDMVPNEFFASKDFVKKVLAIDPCSLSMTSEELKNDKEVVLIAVSIRGFTIKYASDALKRDIELAKVALEKWDNICFRPEDIIPSDVLAQIKK